MGESVVAKEPTCTENGVKKGSCTVCGTTNFEEPIEAKGHSFGEGVVTQEATETETGIKTFTCSVCQETKIEEIPVIIPETEENIPATSSQASVEDEKEISVVGIIIISVVSTIAVLGGGGAAAWYFLIFKKKNN